jgi:hypothetical protein
MPAAAKPPGHRRRRNLAQSRWRTLDAQGRKGPLPRLPAKRPAWLPSTRQWWRRLWASPMAAVYLDSDLGALLRLAYLHDELGRGALSVSGHAAITQLEDRFGLSPKARQQLQWQILDQGELEQQPVSRPRSASVRRLRAVDESSAA